ncbi:unnamed protein product [Urochloa humidicola]
MGQAAKSVGGQLPPPATAGQRCLNGRGATQAAAPGGGGVQGPRHHGLPACEGDAVVASTGIATPPPDPQNITRRYPLQAPARLRSTTSLASLTLA